MKFAGYPSVQAELAAARFQTLERLVGQANDRACALFVVAGDLFDRASVSAKDVRRAAELLNGFHGRLVAVLPGNHDFYSGVSSALWSRFCEAAGDRVLLLPNPQVYDLRHYDLNILLYAGPCDSKHSKGNTISWLGREETAITAAPRDALRIGIAHGSIEGISADAQGVYFPLKTGELQDAPVDLWIIGHSHGQHPSENREIKTAEPPSVLIPGTPEPDGFDCRHGGTAWLIDMDEDRSIRLQSLSTGSYRFIREARVLDSPADLQGLAKWLGSADKKRTLLRLEVSGRLSSEQLIELHRLLAEAEQSLFYTQIDESRLLERISEKTVEAEFTEGSFPYRLLKTLIGEQDFEALQTAYALLQERKR